MKLKIIGYLLFLIALAALYYGKYYIFTEVKNDPNFGLYNLSCGIVGMLGIMLLFINRKRRKNNKI